MLKIIRENRLDRLIDDRISSGVWDYLKRDGRKILDVGCGRDKLPGALGMDVNPRSDAEIIHNLETFPYPIPDQVFDEIRAVSVIEHLEDILKTMEEFHRITKTGGVVKITVPFFASRYFHTDITHKQSFGSRSFDYFDPSELLSRYRYSDCEFRKLKVEFEPLPNIYRRNIERPFVWLANWKKDFYENYLAYLFPMHDIYFELEVVR